VTQKFRDARVAFWVGVGAPDDLARRQAKYELRAAIIRARAAGAKFNEIAKALGVTHQTVRLICVGQHTYTLWDGSPHTVRTHPNQPPILHWMGVPT
jgi:DNA invertase Pin-like site-specific DNA recombinase